MLVDDDTDVRAVTVAGLSEAGFDVVEFDSGQTALARFVPEDLTVLRKPYRVAELVAGVTAMIARESKATNVVPLGKSGI